MSRPSAELAAALRGTAATLVSRRVPDVLGAFFLDVLLLRRLFATAKLRWLAHLLIVVGFTLLLLMHALAPLVTAQLFPGYQPTLDPLSFPAQPLRRDAARRSGAALRRAAAFAREPAPGAPPRSRGVRRTPRVRDRQRDSCSRRTRSRRRARSTAWPSSSSAGPIRRSSSRCARSGPASSGWRSRDLAEPIDPALVEQGRDLHREACASCHARPASAFVSYPVARMMAPVTRFLDRWNAEAWLLDLHVFACLLGLATLPFTRFFHVVASPLGLLVNAATRPGRTSGEALPSPLARRSGRWHWTPACNAASATRTARWHPWRATSAIRDCCPRTSSSPPPRWPAAGCCGPATMPMGRRTAGRRRRFPLHRLRPLHPPLPRGARPRGPVDGRARRPRRRRPSGTGTVGAGTAGAGVGRGPGDRSRAASTCRSGCHFGTAVGRPPHASPAASSARPAPTCARSWRTASTAATAST